MRRAIGTVAAIAALAGCAMFGSGTLDESTPGVMRAGAPPPQVAYELVRAGSSTRQEVAAALGRATVVRFDSGWEVWVYRWRGMSASTASATELVVLFDPSGVARKARVRPGAPLV